MIDLAKRIDEKEQLDNFDIDLSILHRVLRELEFVNVWLGNTKSIVRAIKKIATTEKFQEFTVVDLGCGGGDVLRNIVKVFSRKYKVHCIGIDGNSNTLEYARKESDSQIEYLLQDIFHPSFQLPACDILISSHFVYHFSNKKLSAFLDKNYEYITTAILFSELERSRIAYYMFKITTPLLGFHAVTKEDGLLALRRAFKKKELEKIAADVTDNFKMKRCWAFRFLLSINKKL